MQQQSLGKLASAGLLAWALFGVMGGTSLAAVPAAASTAPRAPAEQPPAASEPATQSAAPATATAQGGKPAPTRDIVDTLGSDEHFATLAEALRGVRGIYTLNDRTYSQIGVRGLGQAGDYGNRVLRIGYRPAS